MEILIKNIMYNLCSIAVITNLTYSMYKKVFAKPASIYIKNEISIVEVGCIANTIILNIYYLCCQGEVPIVSAKYQSLLLIVLSLFAGIFIENVYQRIFRLKKSKYNPTPEEYLFLLITSFLAVAIMMSADGRMPVLDIFIIILGRLIWFDTKSIKALKETITVKHNRIVETSVILLVGVLLISIVVNVFRRHPICKLMLACIYGIVIYKVYGDIRVKQMIKLDKSYRDNKSA